MVNLLIQKEKFIVMKNLRGIALLLLILAPVVLLGQPGNPPAAPIHGVVYLLAAGLGFGILKLREKGKK